MSGVWTKTLQSTSYTTPHCYRSVLSNAKIMMKSKYIYFGEIQLIFKECNIFLMIFICLESMTEIVGGPDIYVDRLSTLQLTCRWWWRWWQWWWWLTTSLIWRKKNICKHAIWNVSFRWITVSIQSHMLSNVSWHCFPRQAHNGSLRLIFL